MKPFNISEYFKIKQKIEECNTFYAALFNLAEITYSNKVDTACINFDKNGNTLNMEINPVFWDSLNETAKTFIVLHELYHVVYDHGRRIIALGGNFHIGNIASDIVINHHLHEKIGICREDFNWKEFCWVETCFPHNPNMISNSHFEYYYNQLSQQKQLKPKKLLGTHLNENKPSNTNQNTDSDSINNPINNLTENNGSDNDFSPENFSDTIKDILNQNPELVNEMTQNPDFSNLGNKITEFITEQVKLGNKHSGAEAEFIKNDEKPSFKKLMKLLVPKKQDLMDEEVEMWIGTHRRYSAFLKQKNNIVLPNVKYNEYYSSNNKKEIWVFMDSSGSCHGMFHAFSNIIMALLKEKKINCRAFSFGDDCREINVNSHTISFFSGNAGGFDCIEDKILEIKKREKINYPDNVVVLSDGGVTFHKKNKLEKPKNWILLINNNNSHNLTPPGGKYIKLNNDFFELDKKNKIKL